MSDHSAELTREELRPVVQAFQEATIPIEPDKRETVPTNLAALRDTLGDATVVGIGETGHGIRECHRLRHRVLRFLVEELDFRIVGIEADFSATAPLNDYLTAGEGSVEATLAEEGFHDFWECEAGRELFEWMRDFNTGREPADQIRVYGLDVQNGRPTVTALRSYLETVDPAYLADVEAELQSLSEERVGVKGTVDDPQSYGETCRTLASQLAARFADERESYVARSSEQAFERAKQQVAHLDQLGDIVPKRYGDEQAEAIGCREEGMAENVSWVLDHESTDRLAVLAHNSHVKRGRWPDDRFAEQRAMGDLLAQADDLEYVSIGCSVIEGEARVVDPADGSWDTIRIPDVPAGSLPDVYSRLDQAAGLIDLHDVSGADPVNDWFGAEPVRQEVASMTHEDPVTYLEADPRTEFDFVAFARTATPARGLE